ncbi:unnamed protein product [Zymoseptoria tritici ST99CH_1A5]|uniref:Uncharacterized protein n=3 Tax=Zymoseptoria tritici TaxID=1047171 RepID=A0A1X7RWL2_ZYMT9|nr:unnamed protein product [Zymoseptoria tritici ST99CH_3D7]SMR54231.1 unnamed protein product [Zymoseptoria tritici ST99CH_1E4]SMR56296.1 unnamed protein product [Zymoseptoria tritici ST99CH_3D1]SMY25478.1 unnamed protein product [Zymoseptoria tritici ST99CH_1A5]
MCQHVKVRYSCGHTRYCVLCWCSRYTDLQKCCPLKVSRWENLTSERCGCCKDTNSLSRRRRLCCQTSMPSPSSIVKRRVFNSLLAKPKTKLAS